MPLSLICACGARIELEDAMAGQEIACPECQQTLKAPAARKPELRTSGFALASTILAVVGAFTVIGSLAAVVLGLIGVVAVLRRRDRLAGLGFAAFGVVAGLVFTGLTLFAVSSLEFGGLDGWLRERNVGDQVDRTGPLEVLTQGSNYAITRPSADWGVARTTANFNDPVAELFLEKTDLLLVQARQNAYVDVRVVPPDPARTLDGFQRQLLAEYQPGRANPFGGDEGDDGTGKQRGLMRITDGKVKRSESVTPAPGSKEGRRLVLDVLAAGRPWRVDVRMYRDAAGRVYVVRAFAPQRWYARSEADFTKALDSFRLLK